MNTLKSAFLSIITICALTISTVSAKRKDVARYLEIFGKVECQKQDISGARVTIFADGEEQAQYKTELNGRFDLKLDMNKVYSVHFDKEGMTTKIVKINTVIPDSPFMAYQYEYKFNVNLDQDLGKPIAEVKMTKTEAQIFYNLKYDGFDCNHEYEREVRIELKNTKRGLNVSLPNVYNDANVIKD
jgi:hypothetical protein